MSRKNWVILIVILVLSVVGLWIWFHRPMCYDLVEIPIPAGLGCPDCLQINDNGTVVGIIVILADHTQHIFYWNRDTGFKDLGNLGIVGKDISISDMNNAGQIVGFYTVDEVSTEHSPQLDITPRRNLHSFFYDPQQGLYEIPATQGRTQPYVKAINNLGQVIGADRDNSNNLDSDRLFLWTLSGGSENLNESGSPHDINDAGHIVGESFPSGNAFIWKRNTGKQFLGNPLTGRQIWTSINQYDDVIGFYGKLNSTTPL